MNHTEIIKAVLKSTGKQQKDLVEQLGVKTQSVVSERIRQKNISVKAFLEILDITGHEIVVRETNGNKEYPIRLSDYQ